MRGEVLHCRERVLGYQGGNSSFQNVSVRQAIQGGDGSSSSCMDGPSEGH